MNEKDLKFFKAVAVAACVCLGLIAYQLKSIARNTERFKGRDSMNVGGYLRVEPGLGEFKVSR